MHPVLFRLNQYNWLGQRLLCQNRYSEISELKNQLTSLRVASEEETSDGDQGRPISEHLSYIDGLAKLRNSLNLEECILALQRLDFQKNNQYFLLLCQCLLYSGNFDAVVAIFRQRLDREIGLISLHRSEGDRTQSAYCNVEKNSTEEKRSKKDELMNLSILSQFHGDSEESLEFHEFYDIVSKNRSINDPKLWTVFSLSLEYQMRYRDADLSYRMACKLATAKNDSNPMRESKENKTIIAPKDVIQPALLSGFHACHLRYAKFCLQRRLGDFRLAIQTLSQACQNLPVDYTLHPLLGLLLCSQPSSGSNHFARALEILSILDANYEATQNPSMAYNQLAMKCKQKLSDSSDDGTWDKLMGLYCLDRKGFDYMLIKSHILINNMIQNSSKLSSIYKHDSSNNNDMNEAELTKQLDKLIDFMRNSNFNYCSMSSLWNNLGLCYLMRRRYVASLSCLLKAQQLAPLDWRVRYNLGLVYLHVGVFHNSLYHLNSARETKTTNNGTLVSQLGPFTQTLMAVSLSQLGAIQQSRRLYARMIVEMKKSPEKTLVLAIVNYLIFLQKYLADDHDKKLMIRLIEFIEQAWLQRNQNLDSQFNHLLLELTRAINEKLLRSFGDKSPMRNKLAWDKV